MYISPSVSDSSEEPTKSLFYRPMAKTYAEISLDRFVVSKIGRGNKV